MGGMGRVRGFLSFWRLARLLPRLPELCGELCHSARELGLLLLGVRLHATQRDLRVSLPLYR